MHVVSFMEPSQAAVIEAMRNHCGVWQSRCPKVVPPDEDELVFERDAAYSGNVINEADESRGELVYVDIDTFTANF